MPAGTELDDDANGLERAEGLQCRRGALGSRRRGRHVAVRAEYDEDVQSGMDGFTEQGSCGSATSCFLQPREAADRRARLGVGTKLRRRCPGEWNEKRNAKAGDLCGHVTGLCGGR